MNKMLTPDLLHDYQKKAIHWQCTRPNSMLWMDVGLGKSIVTLTTVDHLIKQQFLTAVLIAAPIRVCRLVWRQEAKKWEHTKHLTFSMITGTKQQRTMNLLKKADVYLINYENLRWLGETLKTYFINKNRPLPFNGIVWDEITKMKNSTTHRVRSIVRTRVNENAGNKMLDHMAWTTGLTGSPASNGYKDLHGQYLVLDKGRRLGTQKTAFKHRFYRKTGDYKEEPYMDTETTIRQLIGDITLEMSAEDYNPLPDLIVNDLMIELPDQLRKQYDDMERQMFIELDSGNTKEMFNKASLMNSCFQFSNGAIYPIPGISAWEPIHDLKLEALEDILEESNGQPVLCSYAFRSDAERIMKRFQKDYDPINLTACKSDGALTRALRRWREGNCPLMIGHAASMAHGIDGLQDAGSHLIWYGLTWSLDLYDQFNGRLRRQGQGKPVVCSRIMTQNTLDQAQAEALAQKATTEESLRKAVHDYRIMKGV